METHEMVLKIAQADDTQDLLNHIAWTDVVKPRLLKDKEIWEKQLIACLLGTPLPDGMTKEQLAGKIFGINYLIDQLERILKEGKRYFELLKTDLPDLV